ncbi:MAG: 3-hydroxyacyl-CoA dehydrogenase [Pseudomonadota bacterium]
MNTNPLSAELTLGIVGAGAMGRGIAQIAAQAGVRVKLFDVQAGAASGAVDTVRAQFDRLRDKGKLSADAAAKAGDNLAAVSELDALAGCGIVVEAIVEKLDAKRQLLAALEALVGADCILATNTSSLSVTAIAAGAQHPERIAGFHFFNPVPLMKVVEVIAGALTGTKAVDTLAAFARHIGHTPVRASDTPGFIVNHAGRGYLTEALKIVQESVAGFAQVDAILRDSAGFRLGPFQLLDLTGLDVSHPVMESIYGQYYQEPRYRPSVLTAQRLSAGLLGKKSGRGFYDYAEDAPAPTTEPQPAVAPWQGPVWIGAEDEETRAQLIALMARLGVTVEDTPRPSADALCLVAPLGEDVTHCAVRLEIDARRTIGIDPLTLGTARVTLMRNPATPAALAAQVQSAFEQAGQPATLIDDSAGFIVQRVLATIVNIGCDIVQQGICTPRDLDCAVELGLGYPRGPLAWGDHIGPRRVLQILRAMQAQSGDPRYRPSPWLTRRALLNLPLHHVSGQEIES